ncbi:MAG: phosphoribosyltransferase [Dehalococcoidia bacterium]|nr:phosphoribosyltransferase [Dehalococcoidia bacterium]
MVAQFPVPFADRRAGGRALARVVAARPGGVASHSVVLALPRGGVPVGFEVARVLELPLDIVLVRKLGLPGHEELAMGAIASGGWRAMNEEVVDAMRVSEAAIERVAEGEMLELRRREELYRDGRPPIDVTDRPVILVDDGLATGASMRAALQALRRREPSSITVAVPVASVETCREFADIADDIVCAATPEPFRAVGLWYQDFKPTSDAEVRRLLAESRESLNATSGAGGQRGAPR